MKEFAGLAWLDRERLLRTLGEAGVAAKTSENPQLFVRGKAIKTVPEHQIVQTPLDEALQRDWSNPTE